MSMKIHLEFDETDLHNTLKSMIKHPNSEELVKLLTPFIGSSSDCSKWLFKLILGRKLPDVIPVGTLCLTHVNNLTYDVHRKNTLESTLCDNNGIISCTIKLFRGFHDWKHYEVESLGVDDQGVHKTYISYVISEQLEILEEF